MSARSLLRKILQSGAVQNALKQNVSSVASNGANLVQHRIAASSVGLESGLKCAMAEFGLASRGFTAWHGPLLADDKIVDSIGNATGLEREELEAELEGKSRFETAPPTGPFGTKEAPAIVESHFDERIVGCPGGVGDDEHDVLWFHLKKDETFECPVCTQVFQLKVIGPGGPPDGHH